mgnify:FL=1
MYNIVYTNENPDWPVDIFHRYYVHSQLSPSLIDTDRYLITDDAVDNLQDNTFIYPNGKLDENIVSKIKKLLNKKNFILIWNFDHEAFWGDDIKNLYKFLTDCNLPHEKVFVVQSDMNVKKTFDIARKEYDLDLNVNCVYLDAFIYQNMDVFFEDQKIIHREHFDNKDVRDYIYVSYNGNPKPYRVNLVNQLFNKGLDKYGLISLLRDKNPLILDRKFIDHGDMSTQRYPIQHYSQTYFTLVTEGYFHTNGFPSHYTHISLKTEKIYKAMLLNPYILLGGYGTLSQMRDLGFKTFPELFDESYDDIKSASDRFNKVLENIESVCKMNPQKLNSLYHDVLVDKVKYNQDLFINFDRKTHSKGFFEQFKWEI